MNDFSNDVMVALLPTTSDWCKQPFPHLTVVYVGNIVDLRVTDRNELAKEILALALACQSITLDVLGVDELGDGENKVEALLLRPTPQLLAMRESLKTWNASDYHSYLPHATIGPIGSKDEDLPDTLTFDRIVLSWGTENLVFSLLSGKPLYETNSVAV